MKYFLIFSTAILAACQSDKGSEVLVTQNDSLKTEITKLNKELEHRNNIIVELETAGHEAPEEQVVATHETSFKYDPTINGVDIMKHFVSQLYINFPHKIDKEPSETWEQDWTTWAYSWKRKSTPVIYYYRWKNDLMGDGIYQSDPDLKEFSYSQKGIEAFFGNTLDRSNEGLRKLFNSYKRAAYEIITPKIYHETHLGKYVTTLIEVEAYLDGNHNGGKVFFDKLKEIEKSGKFMSHMDYDLYKEIISPNIGQDFMDSYYNKHQFYTGKDLVWFYSFWYRRYQEGNSKTVLKILTEIRDHYYNSNNNDDEVEGC